MSINIIVAVSENNIIGYNGSLPWNIEIDKKYFLEKIKDGIIIEGSKTYIKRGHSLKNTYKTIMLSKTINSSNYKITDNNLLIMNNLIDAIKSAKVFNREIWICGGEDIYKESIRLANKLYITNIYNTVNGDRYFIENWRDYFTKLICKSQIINENNYKFDFEIYEN